MARFITSINVTLSALLKIQHLKSVHLKMIKKCLLIYLINFFRLSTYVALKIASCTPIISTTYPFIFQ